MAHGEKVLVIRTGFEPMSPAWETDVLSLYTNEPYL